MKNTKERGPCVVYGESGCGKTSVMAKTATDVSIELFVAKQNIRKKCFIKGVQLVVRSICVSCLTFSWVITYE